MKSKTVAASVTTAFALAVVLCATGAYALPSIQYVNDPEVPKFGAVLYYSNLGEFDHTYEEIELTKTDNPTAFINAKADLRFAGDINGNSGPGVSYNDAILYAEAISDGSATNGRGGLINGGMDGGVGALKIRGKIQSSRPGNDPVRSYAEATADAYLTFKIEDTNPNMETVRTRFWIETDLAMWNNHDYGGSFDEDDRFVNFATYGGVVQDTRPEGLFDLTTANPDLVVDEDGHLINLVFDDPARPEQYDATDPDAISGAGSGRGGWIPEVDDFMNNFRTRLYEDDLDYILDLIELQEPLLQDISSDNPANNALATNPEFSLGNVTFNDGMGYFEWWFDAEVGHEYAIYVQLSSNIADDGGIDSKFGASGDVEDFGTLYYGLDVVPEPGTIILIGAAVAGMAAIVRRKVRA